MVRIRLPLSMALAGFFAIATCDVRAEPPATSPAPPHTSSGPVDAGAVRGTVVETMNTAGYTYVRVDTGSEEIWAAAPEFSVQTGDRVIVPTGLPMRDHYSKTLDRSFDLVYYAGAIHVEGAPQQQTGTTAPPHPTGIQAAPPEAPDLAGIEKPPGGRTVGELFAEKDSLAGQEVLVRGRVVKFSPEIMGKNWLHLRDGTGAAEANDLTVTTGAAAKVGDTVLVRGTLSTGKDFGFGYRYVIIIEDAEVTVE